MLIQLVRLKLTKPFNLRRGVDNMMRILDNPSPPSEKLPEAAKHHKAFMKENTIAK